MSGRYASQTSVPVERSKAEVEKLLLRYGADQFAYGYDTSAAMVQFRMHGRNVRLRLPMPEHGDREFTHTDTGRLRTEAQADGAWQQARRQRWRALVLITKAKLEAIDDGVASFEDEFLPYMLLPDGSTVAETVGAQVELAYQTGRMPSLLPALGPARGDQ